MKKLSVSLLTVMCVFSAFAALQNDPNAPITGWGTHRSVADAWGKTATYTSNEIEFKDEFIETGFCVSTTSDTCRTKPHQECGYMDSDGCKYDEDEIVTRKDYQLSLATDTLFTQVLGDLEREAQAQYNAKLTEEQNMCVAANSGGIMGRNDMTGTYRWVKLTSRKIPKEYATAGLKTKQITPSNDLYGSFCAARVTIQSDDTDIQAWLNSGRDWATVYFAVGDVFTCGSWIPNADLESIATKVAEKKMKAQGKDSLVTGAGTGKLTTNQKWWLAGATALSAGVGGWGMDALQTGTNFGKLLGTQDRESSVSDADRETVEVNLKTAIETYNSSNNGCNGRNSATKVFTRTGGSYITGAGQLYDWTYINANATHSCTNLYTYIEDLRSALNVDSKGRTKDGRKGRAALDTVAAAGTGIAGFLATRETMKDANKREYDEATQAAINEFMSNVGSHIFCFIGAEEAGTFGDVVEVSME
jgi:hypothetical protein